MRAGKRRLIASIGLIIGLFSGGILAYFLAPRKGEKTQRLLTKKANRLTQKSLKKVDDGLIQLEEALKNKKDYTI